MRRNDTHTGLVYTEIKHLALKYEKGISVGEEKSFSEIIPTDDRDNIIYKQGLETRKR